MKPVSVKDLTPAQRNALRRGLQQLVPDGAPRERPRVGAKSVAS
jgi:hypothetical protein